MGRQVFTAGEILTAANMNDLGDATVMVFDDATARATAIPTPVEGMVTYLKDTDAVDKFDGSDFVPVGVEPGLEFIASATMSAVSSQSFNDVFTAKHDNYRIIFIGQAASVNISFNLRLRVGGVDNSSANYNRQRIIGSGTSVSASRTVGATAYFPGDAHLDPSVLILEIGNPAKESKTSFVGTTQNNQEGSDVMVLHTGRHDVASAFDGFTLLPSSTTLTGTLSVYGYRKA